MAFWTTTPERDPKRNFRFQIFITGVQGTEPAVWWAKKVAKPNFTVAESKHVYLGHTFYYPGKVEWQAISMTLVDPVDPGSLFRINQIIRSGGYVIPGDANTLTTQSKSKTNNAIGKVAFQQLIWNSAMIGQHVKLPIKVDSEHSSQQNKRELNVMVDFPEPAT